MEIKLLTTIVEKKYMIEACKVFVVYPNNITASWLLAYLPRCC